LDLLAQLPPIYVGLVEARLDVITLLPGLVASPGHILQLLVVLHLKLSELIDERIDLDSSTATATTATATTAGLSPVRGDVAVPARIVCTVAATRPSLRECATLGRHDCGTRVPATPPASGVRRLIQNGGNAIANMNTCQFIVVGCTVAL
jgi:hypothetical protein